MEIDSGRCAPLLREPQITRILVVDDCTDTQRLLSDLLSAAGYLVTAVSSAGEAFRFFKATPEVALILMDISMPRIDGIEACKRLHTGEATRDIPVLFLSGHTEVSALEAAFGAGACDYMCKPFERAELLVRVRAAIDVKSRADRLHAYERALLSASRRLEAANEALRHLSFLDQLTGVPNRRYLEMVLDSEQRRAARDGSDLSLILIDIDYFHAFNERYGHPRGDRALRKVADALRRALSRPGDFLARYGGEEFAVILPGTPLVGAAAVAERLRSRVAELKLSHSASSAAKMVTISLGVAGMRQGAPMDALTAAADRALYQAKSDGRNLVRLAPGERAEVRRTRPMRRLRSRRDN